MLIVFFTASYNAWKFTGESSIRIEDSEEDRRAGFVNSILDAGDSGSTAFVDVTDNSLPKKFQMPQIEENRNLNAAGPDLKPGSMFMGFACALYY